MKNVLIIGCGRIAGLNEDDPFEKTCSHVERIKEIQSLRLKVFVISIKKRLRILRINLVFQVDNDIKKALSAIKPELVSIAVPYEFNSEIVHTVAQHINRPKMIF